MNETRLTLNSKCQNFRFEPDGYCAACGKYHFTIAFGKVNFHADPVEESQCGYADGFEGAAVDPEGEDGFDSFLVLDRKVFFNEKTPWAPIITEDLVEVDVKTTIKTSERVSIVTELERTEVRKNGVLVSEKTVKVQNKKLNTVKKFASALAELNEVLSQIE